MKKILKRKIVWNNVGVFPKKKGIWYRFYDSSRKCVESVMHKGSYFVKISWFTSDNDVCGWTAALYRNKELVSWKDYSKGGYIKTKRIGLAEDEALNWANHLIL